MNLTTLQTPTDSFAPIPIASARRRLDEVLRNPMLSQADKRQILSSWASDAHSVENKPWLRLIPGDTEPLPLTAILQALRRLDDDDPPPKGGAVIRLAPRLQEIVDAAPARPRKIKRAGGRPHGLVARHAAI
jgi:hypothetical protein